MGITSTPSEGSKSPSVSVSPLKTRIRRRDKKTFTVSPVQTRSESRKIPETDEDAVKKLLFPGKCPKFPGKKNISTFIFNFFYKTSHNFIIFQFGLFYKYSNKSPMRH